MTQEEKNAHAAGYALAMEELKESGLPAQGIAEMKQQIQNLSERCKMYREKIDVYKEVIETLVEALKS